MRARNAARNLSLWVYEYVLYNGKYILRIISNCLFKRAYLDIANLDLEPARQTINFILERRPAS